MWRSGKRVSTHERWCKSGLRYYNGNELWRRHSGETWNVEKKTASEEEEKRKSRV